MYPVPVQAKGRLWIMPCPRADHLRTDIAAYRAAGVSHLVSMLAPDEAQELGLAQEQRDCRAAGMVFHTHPIKDFGLPDLTEFIRLTGQITQWINQGHRVAVHCRAGIGRSGMVTAAVLINLGETAANAIALVSAARHVSIPDTVEQGVFITSLSNLLK